MTRFRVQTTLLLRISSWLTGVVAYGCGSETELDNADEEATSHC
jgi:hypothetical protein